MGEEVLGRLINKDFHIAGGIKDNESTLDSGLMFHLPLDSRAGTFDCVGGYQAIENTCTGLNLAELLGWRNTDNWTHDGGMSWDEEKQAIKVVGYQNCWLRTPIVVDINKHYRISIDVMIEERSTHSTGEGYLYMGGLMNNILGQRVTSNYDYTLASSSRPTIGEWVTFKYTRYGNGTASSGNRYSYDSTTGWMGTTSNESITDKLCRFWHFGGLWNYSSGGIMYFKNLKIEIFEEEYDEIYYENGRYIGLGTISNNIISNPDLKIVTGKASNSNVDPNLHSDALVVSGWGNGFNTGVGDTIIGYHAKYVREGTNVLLKMVDRNDIFGLGHRWIGVSKSLGTLATLGWEAGDEITLSFDVRVSVIGKGHGGLYHKSIATGTYVFGNTSFNIGNYIKKEHEWVRFAHTITITEDMSRDNAISFFFYGTHGDYGTIWWDNFQCEKLSYATPFVVGNRTIKQSLSYDIQRSGAFSLIYEFRPTPYNSAILSEANAVISANNNSLDFLMWKRTDENYYRIRVQGIDMTFSSNEVSNEKRNLIGVVCDGTDTKIYLDGVLKHTFTDKKFVINTLLLNEYEGVFGNNEFYDVKLYNRALSDEEIKMLYRKGFRLTQDGDITCSVIEGLDLGTGRDGDLSLSSDLRVGTNVYVTDSVLKGSRSVQTESTTGLREGDEVIIYQTQDGIKSLCGDLREGWSITHYAGRTSHVVYDGVVEYGDSYIDRICKATGLASGDTNVYLTRNVDVTAGRTYCLSFLFKSDRSHRVTTGSQGYHAGIDWYGSSNNLISFSGSISNNTTTGNWTRCYIWGTAPDGATYCRLRVCFTGDLVVGQHLYVTSPMFHEGELPLPYRENHGRYEFKTIKSLSPNNITFNSEIERDYGSGYHNLVYSSVTQIIKVMHYNNITINSDIALRPHVWDGKRGGVLALRVRENLDNNGWISAGGAGYRGGRCNGVDGYSHTDGEAGEGYYGRGLQGFYSGNVPYNKDNGGTCYVNGSGGSHKTLGTLANSYEGYQSLAGLSCGDSSLIRLYFGGGGSGGHHNAGTPIGGRGAGIVMLYCKDAIGSIHCNGTAGSATTQGLWGSGGGAGGSIYVECYTNALETQVNGGDKFIGTRGDTGAGGDGGEGRVYITEYAKKHILSNNSGMKSIDGELVVGHIKQNL